MHQMHFTQIHVHALNESDSGSTRTKSRWKWIFVSLRRKTCKCIWVQSILKSSGWVLEDKYLLCASCTPLNYVAGLATRRALRPFITERTNSLLLTQLCARRENNIIYVIRHCRRGNIFIWGLSCSHQSWYSSGCCEGTYLLTYFLITYLPHSSTFWGWDPDPDPDPCSTFISIHEYFAFSLYIDTPCRFWVLTPKRLTSALRNLSSSLGRLYIYIM